ncbi:hypothetical protein GCK72_001280 [Caenorhabditis remanei]|uniref:Ig-like domain-containing protein n=1 Tax=Caenorhabditis remanei TaxID=31234 RepID=A0A6A5HTA3_CAERE|nr:hypothetical protein GCK72_001280 [Caenorhabditis remanei]KAF1769463.1 hypothetical protein GCK72_001280 [Caenorhabditis remanei]
MVVREISTVFILFAVFSVLSADSSCKGTCTHDGYPLPCGVWLKNETKSASLGTYALNSGVAKLHCSFSSLPEPVQIQWMFRPSDSATAQWREFPCAKKEEHKNCQKEEIIVESHCEVRMNSLKMSGTYKCAATIPNQHEQRYRAFSSEFAINVVGIEPLRVISSRLPLNKNGEINLEVCANPRPEVFWHTVDGIISPEKSSKRFAVTSLTPRTSLKVQSEPLSPVPYCYRTSLLIHKVQENDEFHMSIRGELNIVHEKITVKVKSSNIISGHYLLILISSLFFIF